MIGNADHANMLDALVLMQTDALDAKFKVGRGDVAALGPLSALIAGPDGWLDDGLSRTRDFLGRLLAEAVKEESLTLNAGTDHGTVRQVLGHMWGVYGAPVSANAALKRVKGTTRIDQGTPKTWQSRLFASGVVSAWVDNASQSLAQTDVDQLSFPRPTWPAGRPDEWPPSGSVRDALVNRVRKAAPDAVGLELFDALAILRRVTARYLRGYLANKFEDSQAFRYLGQKVLPSWESAPNFLYFPPTVDRVNSGGKFTYAVAAATQMIMYGIDLTAFEGAARESLLSREFFSANGMQTVRTDLVRNGTDIVAGSAEFGRVLRSEEIDIGHLSTLSAAVRSAKGDAKPVQSKLYLDARKMLPRDISSSEFVKVALADHSVQLDMVVSEKPGLVRQLADLINELGSTRLDGKRILEVHTHRNEVLLSNKSNATELAIGHGACGYAIAEKLMRSGVLDVIGRMEVLQQLDLALAGVFIRALERSFTEGRTRNAVTYSGWAMWFSMIAVERLQYLESPEVGGGLPTVRHADERISTVSWRIQTRLIRLRVLISIHAAIAANMLTAKEVQACSIQISGRRDVAELNMKDALTKVQADLGMPAILEYYRQFVVMPELTSGNQLEFVRVAAFLAFLNSGNVPVEIDLSTGLEDLDFLDASPDDISAGLQFVRLDVDKLSSWVAERTTDLGILSWLEPKDSVRLVLEKRSDATFSRFVELHKPHRPGVPSHD